MHDLFSVSVSQHAVDRRALDVRESRDDEFVDDQPTLSTALPVLASRRHPRSVLTSWLGLGLLPVMALCVAVMTVVVWTGVAFASISQLITALVFLIVLGFYRALRVTNADSRPDAQRSLPAEQEDV